MKPILFNTKMVRAILEGRKTVTRRVVKQQHLLVLDSQYHKEHPETPDKSLIVKLCEPPYRPGDIIYVRETFSESADGYAYKADEPDSDGWGWNPSIHMPKEAARIFFRVTAVWVERLQDITIEDIHSEGWPEYFMPTDEELRKMVTEFVNLWDSTIKPADLPLYGWESNPFVWVIEFEKISKEEALKNENH